MLLWEYATPHFSENELDSWLIFTQWTFKTSMLKYWQNVTFRVHVHWHKSSICALGLTVTKKIVICAQHLGIVGYIYRVHVHS